MDGNTFYLLAAYAAAGAGWLVWSLGHYAVHRLWHWLLATGLWRALAYGEWMHHQAYDVPAAINDPEGRYKGFPLWIGVPLVCLASVVFGWLAGAEYVLAFFGAALLSSVTDISAHDATHELDFVDAPPDQPRTLVAQLHRVHHATHRHNFAVHSGLVWDLIFRTYRAR